MSRDLVLARIKDALARPSVHHPARPAPPIARGPAADPDPVARFAQRFTALGGVWHEAGNPALVAELVRSLAGGQPVWVSRGSDGTVARLDLEAGLAALGVPVARGLDEGVDADAIRLAVTGTTLAVADTGSLAVIAEPGQGRLSSVATPVHVALLSRDRIVASLGEALGRLGPLLGAGRTSAAIVITGPSRTADIEGQLVVGVHGPAEIHCVLID